MKGWHRVRTPLVCSYGCAIPWQEWAWFGKWPMVLCESHAARYGMARPVDAHQPQDAERRTT